MRGEPSHPFNFWCTQHCLKLFFGLESTQESQQAWKLSCEAPSEPQVEGAGAGRLTSRILRLLPNMILL